jgi:DNA-binding HxlR family transcriptional regulator
VLAEILSAGRLGVADLEHLFSTVNRRTLQRDLKRLPEKGLVRESGSGPTDPDREYLPGDL